jgi:UDP-N-acetylmuramoyl-L-alanyl-D-glutamate--2,6-diaminopimelate ligase
MRIGIINADESPAEEFSAAVKNPILYGVDKGDVRAANIQLTSKSVQYEANIEGKTYHIRCHIPGSFNVYNSLAAVCVGRAVGLTQEEIERGIAALDSVEGRMTRIDEGQKFSVIVDFAHTPDSFEKLFKDIKPVVKGKLIVLFGSAGRRDEEKRGIQGRLAGEYADEVILTEEDDRDIDGMKILDEIATGAEAAGKKRKKDLFLVHDRTEAIRFAFSRAKEGDTVLLLGKGHEKTIERADGEHPWDEIGTAHSMLREL